MTGGRTGQEGAIAGIVREGILAIADLLVEVASEVASEVKEETAWEPWDRI